MARIIDGAEMNLIGSNLKRLRQERGWSQQLLSNKLETVAVYICRGSISRIEDKQNTIHPACVPCNNVVCDKESRQESSQSHCSVSN